MAFSEKQKMKIQSLIDNVEEFKKDIYQEFGTFHPHENENLKKHFSGYLYQYFIDGDGILDKLWHAYKIKKDDYYLELLNFFAQNFPQALEHSAKGKSSFSSTLIFELDHYIVQKQRGMAKSLSFQDFYQKKYTSNLNEEEAEIVYGFLKNLKLTEIKSQHLALVQYNLKANIHLLKDGYCLEVLFKDAILKNDIEELKIIVEQFKNTSEYREYSDVKNKLSLNNDGKKIYSKYVEVIKKDMGFFDTIYYADMNRKEALSIYQYSLLLLSQNKSHQETHDYLINDLKINTYGKIVSSNYNMKVTENFSLMEEIVEKKPEMKEYIQKYLKEHPLENIWEQSRPGHVYIKSATLPSDFNLFILMQRNDLLDKLFLKNDKNLFFRNLLNTEFPSKVEKFESLHTYISKLDKGIDSYFSDHVLKLFMDIDFEKMSLPKREDLFHKMKDIIEHADEHDWLMRSYVTIFQDNYFRYPQLRKILNSHLDFEQQHYNFINSFKLTNDEKIIQGMSDFIKEYPVMLEQKTNKHNSGLNYLVSINMLHIVEDEILQKNFSHLDLNVIYNQNTFEFAVQKILELNLNLNEKKYDAYNHQWSQWHIIFNKLENLELLEKIYDKLNMSLIDILSHQGIGSVFNNDAIGILFNKKYQELSKQDKDNVKIRLSELLSDHFYFDNLKNKLFNKDGCFNEVLLTQNKGMNILHTLCKDIKTNSSRKEMIQGINFILKEIQEYPEGEILLKQKYKKEQPLVLLLKSCSVFNKKTERLPASTSDALKECVMKMVKMNNHLDDTSLSMVSAIIDKENLEKFFPRLKDIIVEHHLNYHLDFSQSAPKKIKKI